PLFVYDQHEPDETLWGGGVGLATRIYRNTETFDGFFAEAGAGLIGHDGKLEGNSASIDFLLEAGVGYRFPDTDWHVALKFNHLSNGGLASSNGGTNGFGLGFGYRF
ncbi:MAG: acyloxyacyl hydrolase, partial [Candidatus Hydrogenedentes bacterium]|nr:acyloxyacyl hydrolase [Candidatus Hydrogenedentota bacterium]